LDNKIKLTLEKLQNYDLVISNFNIIDSSDNIIKKNYNNKKPFISNYMLSALSPHYTGCSMAFRRNILNYVLPFPSDMSCGHDNWIGLCVAKYGKIFYLDVALINHRLHINNSSYLGRKSKNNFIKRIRLRFYALINIVFKSYCKR
jgi:hypothetical protein